MSVKMPYVVTKGIQSYDDVSFRPDKKLETALESQGLTYSQKTDWGETIPYLHMPASNPEEVRRAIVSNRELLEDTFNIQININELHIVTEEEFNGI